MISILKYGVDASLRLDLSPEALVTDCAAPPGMDDSDTVSAAAQATQTPLDFPPLRQATVPGDHVVIALGPAVPQAADVVSAIVTELLCGGAAAEDVTVLQASGSTALYPSADGLKRNLDPRKRLPPELRDAVQLATHDPAHRNGLSYLAADSQGLPIYLNRLLCDADLVIPVGCLRLDDPAHRNGSTGIWNDTIYPTFSDLATLDHFAPNGVPLTAGQIAHRHRQVDQVAWLLGVQITAQVVPAAGDKTLRVFAGIPEAVFRQGRAVCQSAWERKVPRRASLVVAGVGGGSVQQTWMNVGRALEAALRVAIDGGAIVLCTELDEPLGPALKLLAHSTDTAATQMRLRKQRSADASLARLLAESLEHVTVYLLSDLTEEVVSPLGFAHVNDAAEIVRLATHYDSCILLPDAQHVWPTVEGEEPYMAASEH
ncbi:MAG TPA: lactate racemase domain-containing protein [Pirellulales bacterium]|nr:lactate racemase domain-containing protein [Pirellulales bacterium]